MANTLIWSACTSLLAILLFRGVRVGLYRKYPLFYAYIACVFVKGLVDQLSFLFVPNLYKPLYWYTEFATIVASYVVILEIFRESLRHNPGIAHKSQKLLLSIFALTLSYATTGILHSRSSSAYGVIVDLGRDLRYIEGALLLVMLWLFVRYRISFGRNLVGLVAGYSFWIAVNIVNLAVWFLPGNAGSLLLRRLLPLTYIATLTIWCFALWSLQPDLAQQNENAIERDYQVLAAKTRSVLTRSSARLVKVMRP